MRQWAGQAQQQRARLSSIHLSLLPLENKPLILAGNNRNIIGHRTITKSRSISLPFEKPTFQWVLSLLAYRGYQRTWLRGTLDHQHGTGQAKEHAVRGLTGNLA